MFLCILLAAFIDLVCQNTHLFWVYDLMIFSPFVERPSPLETVTIVSATCYLLPPVLPLVDTSHKGKDGHGSLSLASLTETSLSGTACPLVLSGAEQPSSPGFMQPRAARLCGDVGARALTVSFSGSLRSLSH